MPRRSRIVVPGLPHHIVQRGSRRCQVFFEDQDRQLYLELLRRYASRNQVKVLAYCLMTTHVHHVLIPARPDSLARTLSATHMRYAHFINARNSWTGHLWQERFFSSPLDEEYLFTAVRYVERNPVAAGIVNCATLYPWSSAASHSGLRADPTLSATEEFLMLRSITGDWKSWLEGEEDVHRIQRLKDCTCRDLPCGSDQFNALLEEKLGVTLRRAQRRLGTEGTVPRH